MSEEFTVIRNAKELEKKEKKENTTLKELYTLKSQLEDLTDDTPDMIEAEIGMKGEGYIILNDKFENELERIDNIIKMYQEAKKRIKSNQDKVKFRLAQNLEEHSPEGLKTDLGKIYLRKVADSLVLEKSFCENLEVDHKELFTELVEVEYKRILTPRKELIKEKLNAGIKIEGAVLLPQDKTLVIPKLKGKVIE